MGQITNDIDAIVADDGLTRPQKLAAIGQVKINAVNSFIQNNLPYTVVIDAERTVTFTSAIVSATPGGGCRVSAFGDFTRNGVPQTFDWPWVLINPPMLTRAQVEDPAEAFREVCDQVFV